MSASADGYPPYNIEVIDESNYAITVAVAGFDQDDLDLQVKNNTLTIRGNKKPVEENENQNFLHRGIATRSFERKFQLADYVEITNANLQNGLLTIELVKEIPEAMKPRSIPINDSKRSIEHQKAA